jgi:hypothetical protein
MRSLVDGRKGGMYGVSNESKRVNLGLGIDGAMNNDYSSIILSEIG